MLHRPTDSVPAQQLCSSHTDRLHLPSHTHRLTHSPHTHAGSHTPQTHTPSHSLTHSSLTLTHPHILLTHLNTSLAHSSHTPQTHTLFTPTYTLTHTHPHTLLTCAHTHTYTHTITEPTGAMTQETRGPRGSAHTPGTWSMWEQPRVPAELSRWTHWGPLGLLEAP